MSGDDRDPVDRAIEVLVYAPLGLGLWLRDLAPSVLDTIVAKATQLSGTEAGAIYVRDGTTDEFALRATYGMSEELIAVINEEHVGISEAVREATDQREPVQVADLRDDPPRLPARPGASASRFRKPSAGGFRATNRARSPR